MENQSNTPAEQAQGGSGQRCNNQQCNQFTKSFWKTAKKRHCDARQNMRTLLDRYVKPHH